MADEHKIVMMISDIVDKYAAYGNIQLVPPLAKEFIKQRKHLETLSESSQIAALEYTRRINELKAALLEIYEIAWDDHEIECKSVMEKIGNIADRALYHPTT